MTSNENKPSILGNLFGISFYIEVFGVFIPGVVAIGATVLIGSCLIWYGTGENIFNLLHGRETNSAYSIGGLFIIALSYAVGAVLYRRGPKHPDYIAAYNQCVRTRNNDERDRLAYKFIEDDEGGCKCFICRISDWMMFAFHKYAWIKKKSKYNPDFPYPFLRRYLYKRGFAHLVDYVNWCDGWKEYVCDKKGVMKNDKGNRSKQAINVIKVRLAPLVPSKVNDNIVRNESHVRLISSLWYVMRYVRAIAVIGLIVLLVCTMFKKPENISYLTFIMEHNKEACFFWCATFCFVSLILMLSRIKVDIETSIHYVRVRELITILEYAWVYDNKLSEGNKPKLFDDIVAAGRQFHEDFCKNCKHHSECCPVAKEGLHK